MNLARARTILKIQASKEYLGPNDKRHLVERECVSRSYLGSTVAFVNVCQLVKECLDRS